MLCRIISTTRSGSFTGVIDQQDSGGGCCSNLWRSNRIFTRLYIKYIFDWFNHTCIDTDGIYRPIILFNNWASWSDWQADLIIDQKPVGRCCCWCLSISWLLGVLFLKAAHRFKKFYFWTVEKQLGASKILLYNQPHLYRGRGDATVDPPLSFEPIKNDCYIFLLLVAWKNSNQINH